MVTSYLSNRTIYIERDVVLVFPRDPYWDPLLWNILYDGVLSLELVVDAMCIDFADDLALVVAADNEHSLMGNTDLCLDMVRTWMRDDRLELAPCKTEMLLMKGKRSEITSPVSLTGLP